MSSFSGNCVASTPISTFMCLWASYIFPGSVHIFSCSRIGKSIVETRTVAAQFLFGKIYFEFSVLVLSCVEATLWNGEWQRV
jgi:uncharacterized membrane protein